MIGDKNNYEVIKVKEFIEDHYFGKSIKNDNKNEEIIYGNELNVTITDDFSKYKDIKYDLIVSFKNLKEENINIIKTFKKANYLFYRICQKQELINETNSIISSNNLLLSNHFRRKINDFLEWDYDNSLSQTSLSNDSEYTNYKKIKD